ncbi:hypothetical protein [Nannocystis punicea]|uniref:NanoRNase/pAp phosphatase, hydrolyzes c-di-AMP and oligoRNAs n=1 Tax=Nannocystis punicea TaxID=2995304 RepID=A0ABY7GSM4_9BACT|nr:hypothetical protein [Nannocystis poenicansa]WAS89929.1 hypothetical protein O0S08_27360 [Nannocystis poenicansa]
MAVHILHHGWCFDGAASAALFAAFDRQRHGPRPCRLIPKDHRPGDPYDPGDFEADEVASVDFRYSQHPRLAWYFDHHASAFQLPGDREHFLADTSGQKFHDPTASSCAGYLARILRDRFACDLSAHGELIRWAEIIDSAAFPDPRMPVELTEPALLLMTFVENNHDRELGERFIHDLLTCSLADLAVAGYVQRLLQPRLEQNRHDIRLIGETAMVEGDVLHYSLLDQPVRAYNKFIPYYHHPKIRYVVALTRGPDRRIKLTAGYNPWLPRDAREHSMAALLEPHGGGGHPYVAGCTFGADDEDRAVAVQRAITAVLRGNRPAGPSLARRTHSDA